MGASEQLEIVEVDRGDARGLGAVERVARALEFLVTFVLIVIVVLTGGLVVVVVMILIGIAVVVMLGLDCDLGTDWTSAAKDALVSSWADGFRTVASHRARLADCGALGGASVNHDAVNPTEPNIMSTATIETSTKSKRVVSTRVQAVKRQRRGKSPELPGHRETAEAGRGTARRTPPSRNAS